MTDTPLSDPVAQLYERWPYPEPARTLDEWHATTRHLPDPELQYKVFWPDLAEYPSGLDVLIAGCGANQAAELAYHNPSARVLGIDVSAASLANQQRLKDTHQLANLELQRIPIEESGALGRDFDLIISTGVLHHIADPGRGLQALGRLLRPNGVMSLMLYAKHGWGAVRVMWEFFHLLRLPPIEDSVPIIREALDRVPPYHPIKRYLDLGPWDLGSTNGLFDSFLHPRAQVYSVPEVLDLVDNAGLAFQGWLSSYLYYPECMPSDSDLYRSLSKLPERDLWAAMELYYALGNACHYFNVCRPDRPRQRYAIDFAGDQFMNYTPEAAPELSIVREPSNGRPVRLLRRGIDSPLEPAQSIAFSLVDGKRTIRQILDGGRLMGVQGEPEQMFAFAREFFRSLWRLELIYVQIPDLK